MAKQVQIHMNTKQGVNKLSESNINKKKKNTMSIIEILRKFETKTARQY